MADLDTNSFTPQSDPDVFREYELGSKLEGKLKRTFHVYKSYKQVGYYLEKVFDESGSLISMVKRTQDGRSETRFDENGDVAKIFESYTLPDGNILTKEKKYLAEDRTKETVLVISPRGHLVRSVLREAKGLINLFQSQTEFIKDGIPSYSVNHWFEPDKGVMVHREQIQWLQDGVRGLTEHFRFSPQGQLHRYHKILFHPTTQRYLEEAHLYDADKQILLKKEVKTYSSQDSMAQLEITTYDANGQLLESNRLFTQI